MEEIKTETAEATSITEEQIIAAQSILNEAPLTAAIVIDQARVQELETMFMETILNPRFWENENRVKRLEVALTLPAYDDPSMRMFYDSAKDELTAEAMAYAIKNKLVPVEPTDDQIKERAEQKHYEKYVLEPARKAERAAKRAAKNK